jgi:hypothetical protein
MSSPCASPAVILMVVNSNLSGAKAPEVGYDGPPDAGTGETEG